MHTAYQWLKSQEILSICLAYMFFMKYSDDINVTIQMINQSIQGEHEHQMQTAIFDYITNIARKYVFP